MDPAAVGTGGMLNLEKELICFICTEILYQPLTLIDCLHTFCGSCLKSWFQLQHHKACASHHSSSTSANPYTCPTCRATVKTARPNAMVNTWLELYLAANPSRAPTQEDKDEKSANYRPGDDILPKVVRGRRRERRHRRDEEEAIERRMIEEARERSLREAETQAATRTDLLEPNPPAQDTQHSRSRERDREREERRARRREVERQRRQRVQASEQEPAETIETGHDEEQEDQPPALPPVSSPRHPDAVEERQRQQRVMHQASLVSLISSSEGTTGSSIVDSLDENALRDLIMAEGLYEGIDLNGLTEAEQDVLAERVAEAFRRWQRSQHENGNQQPPQPLILEPANSEPTPIQSNQANQNRSRNRSASTQRRTETHPPTAVSVNRPRSSRTSTVETSTAPTSPPSSVVVTQRRRRPSNQSQSNVSIRTRSRQSSPPTGSGRSGNNSPANFGSNVAIDSGSTERPARPVAVTRSSTEPHSSAPSNGLGNNPTTAPAQVPTPPASQNVGIAPTNPNSSSSPKTSTSQLPPSGPRSPRSTSRTLSQSGMQALTLFDEPSVTCFRCYRSDIQYEVYKYCGACDVSLCLNCYRGGRGCKYWYGFGPSALARFAKENADRRDSEQVPLPHELVGRLQRMPHRSLIVATKLAKDGETTIPTRTMSDPTNRLQEGYFCDRCSAFANSTFYTCDTCNMGDWGFCKDCVNTHHCCTHPLRPIAHQISQTVPSRQVATDNGPGSPVSSPGEMYPVNLAPHSLALSQPGSATSTMSNMAGPRPGSVFLQIRTNCDQCSILIDPSFLRYHCPFHLVVDANGNKAPGNYDICTSCYHSLVKTNRVKRDDGPAGWRKCPLGHRMIITEFVLESDGGFWRNVRNDLVGGRYFSEEHIKVWMEILNRERDTGATLSPTVDLAEFDAKMKAAPWKWRNEQSSDLFTTRQRNLALLPSSKPWANQALSNNTNAAPTQKRFQFPPEGGFGARAFARFTRQPEDGDAGKDELAFPKNADICELEWINDDFWYGSYAGDWGFVPAGYMRSVDGTTIM